MPAPIRMAASCYSSSQLAAISSTVTEPWSISAPVYQWMFIERTVWAASADTTCNQKEERRRESVNPQIYQVRKATRREKKKQENMQQLGICHDRKSEEKRKKIVYNRIFIVEMQFSAPFMSLVLNLTLEHSYLNVSWRHCFVFETILQASYQDREVYYISIFYILCY